MTDILERIYAAKARARAADEAREPYEIVRERALRRKADRRGFSARLRAALGPAIIGEIKRASPSVGLIARNFDPERIARTYTKAGVDAISVLTESDHFLGELRYLELVRAQTPLPILRKDFLSTPYEIAQSAAYGADAILLIVAGLTDEQLAKALIESRQYDLDALVEIHDADDLRRALALGVTLVGVNNRNLRTFETDLAVSEHLIPRIPREITVVSESGMRDAEDVARLHDAGARGFLIGEALMRLEDPSAVIREFKRALARGVPS